MPFFIYNKLEIWAFCVTLRQLFVIRRETESHELGIIIILMFTAINTNIVFVSHVL